MTSEIDQKEQSPKTSPEQTSAATQLYSAVESSREPAPINGAHELIRDPSSGQGREIPLTKLSAGDHDVKLNDGREFAVHVPANDGKTPLPVMFVFAGSAHGNFNIKDFEPESGMNKFADSPDNKFITVYPFEQKHYLGTGSANPAFGWNVLDPKGGVLIDKADSQKAGYDDLSFVNKIVGMMPQLANVDSSHKNWAAIGFSQGGIFLNYLAAKDSNLFPTIGLVGTAMASNYKYDTKPGNAENVAIVNLRADERTLPFKDHVDYRYRLEEFLHMILFKSRFEKLDDLAAIDNLKSDPAMQQSFYLNRLGKHSSESVNFNTPSASEQKDHGAVYHSLVPGSRRQLSVYDLPTANHSFPEKDPSGARTNATAKYTEFETDKHIVDQWMQYNSTLKQKGN